MKHIHRLYIYIYIYCIIVFGCDDNDLGKVSSDNDQGEIKLHHYEYDIRISGAGCLSVASLGGLLTNLIMSYD